jgi:hypothetical protein
VQSFKTIYRRKREKFRFNFGIFCEMWRVTPPSPPTMKLRQKSGKIPVKILIFSGKICLINNYLCEMIIIFVKYTVNLHPTCLRICFRKRQNCSPRASKMEQFSGGGPPNPRFLPKLSITVQVNSKKLYYNYYTLGKYLLIKNSNFR